MASNDTKLVEDLGKMLSENKFYDVTLKCNDGKRTFKAHKAMLTARSPVFEAMFSNDLEESKSNEINILDIDAEVMENMLEFIYCGKITNLELCYELYIAADKYQIGDLTEVCYQHLLNDNITLDNLVNCFKLADTYNLTGLMGLAISFLQNNNENVEDVLMPTKEWKDMLSQCPNVVNEIIMTFITEIRLLREENKKKKKPTIIAADNNTNNYYRHLNSRSRLLYRISQGQDALSRYGDY